MSQILEGANEVSLGSWADTDVSRVALIPSVFTHLP